MSRHRHPLKRVAVTGGIGSGKSTLVRALSQLGYAVFDADRLAAEAVLQPDIRAKIEALLGSEAYAVDEHGQDIYQRGWVRDQVFSDEQKRKSLESIIHPALFSNFEDICRRLDSLAGGVWVFYEAALIFEAGRESHFDAVVSVLTPENERRMRLKASRGLSDDVISAIFAAQVSDHVRRSRSNFVFENTGSVDEVPRRALELLEDLRQFFHPKSH
ncbi:MAG: dephospho-CoA kinase [Betaproteobacteria bacterium]|nr:dephospho-CoA kinase [Betaproteobacteria bacterium]